MKKRTIDTDKLIPIAAFTIFIIAVALAFCYANHQINETHAWAQNKINEIDAEQKAKQKVLKADIDAGYTVYVDGTKVEDTDSVNIKSNKYTHSIDDDKKIIYFETKQPTTTTTHTTVMPMPLPIMY